MLSPEERLALGEHVEHIKDIAEGFEDAFEASKDSPFMDCLEKALPWLEDAGDALPFIKVAATILGRLLKQRDPEVLGFLACTLAYQQASAQAFRVIGRPNHPVDCESPVLSGAEFGVSNGFDFKRMTLANAAYHEFTVEADRALVSYARNRGYCETECTRLRALVHRRFVDNLRLVLSHPDTADKFQPFSRLITLDGSRSDCLAALENHELYQRRIFYEARLFNAEPFALGHVYVDMDSDLLT